MDVVVVENDLRLDREGVSLFLFELCSFSLYAHGRGT